MRDPLPILIIGAGIAGLSLARVLEAQGLRVKVLEKATRTQHQGYGITLRDWALLPLCQAAKIEHPALISEVATDAPIHGRGFIDGVIRDLYSGERLSEPAAAPTGSPAAAYFRANRNRIRDFLLERLDVSFGTPLIAVEADAGHVWARLDNGDLIEGEAIIAADGVNSTVRSLLLPHIRPITTPVAMGAGIRRISRQTFDQLLAPYLQGSSVLAAAGDHLLVSVTVVNLTAAGAELFWTYFRPVTSDADPMFLANQDRNGNERLRQLVIEEIAQLGTFAEPFAWTFELGRLRSDEIFNWAMRSLIIPHTDLSALANRKVVMIGDAAHAMAIFAGEGGNHAILDAVELGRRLSVAPRDVTMSIMGFYRDAEHRWATAVQGSVDGLHRLTRPLEAWRRSPQLERRR